MGIGTPSPGGGDGQLVLRIGDDHAGGAPSSFHADIMLDTGATISVLPAAVGARLPGVYGLNMRLSGFNSTTSTVLQGVDVAFGGRRVQFALVRDALTWIVSADQLAALGFTMQLSNADNGSVLVMPFGRVVRLARRGHVRPLQRGLWQARVRIELGDGDVAVAHLLDAHAHDDGPCGTCCSLEEVGEAVEVVAAFGGAAGDSEDVPGDDVGSYVASAAAAIRVTVGAPVTQDDVRFVSCGREDWVHAADDDAPVGGRRGRLPQLRPALLHQVMNHATTRRLKATSPHVL